MKSGLMVSPVVSTAAGKAPADATNDLRWLASATACGRIRRPVVPRRGVRPCVLVRNPWYWPSHCHSPGGGGGTDASISLPIRHAHVAASFLRSLPAGDRKSILWHGADAAAGGHVANRPATKTVRCGTGRRRRFIGRRIQRVL